MPELDPILTPEEIERCACGAALWRAVLFASGATTACMACGHVRMLSTEYAYSDNPHVDPKPGPTRSLTLDGDTAPWLGAFPRVAAEARDVFLPATLRAASAESLAAAESDAIAQQPKGLAARIRHAGVPGPPVRRDLRMEVCDFLEVHDALALDESSSIDRLLEILRNDRPIAVTIAEELLATPRWGDTLVAYVELGKAPLPHALVWRVIRLSQSPTREAFGAALAVRLTRLLPTLEAADSDIDETLAALGTIGRAAAPARAALEAVRASDTAARHSTMRAALDRIFANIA